MRYLLKDAPPGIEILPQSIDRQYYAFGLKTDFPQHESLNRILLDETNKSQWQEILNRYLGQR